MFLFLLRNEFAVKKAKLVVDRPFIFYIFDHVNQIPLFVGRIVDPNGKLKLQ
jgi:serine protease inhibitor